MKLKLFTIVFTSILGFSIGYSLHHCIHKVRYPEVSDVIVLTETPYYLMEDLNAEVLYKTLEHYEFPHPEIITAQAILETGDFKSRLCKTKNNIFGLYNSRELNYFRFDSWISCVFAYKKYILDGRYDGEQCFYQYLQDIGYAEDSLYIPKVRHIVDSITNKYKTE